MIYSQIIMKLQHRICVQVDDLFFMFSNVLTVTAFLFASLRWNDSVVSESLANFCCNKRTYKFTNLNVTDFWLVWFTIFSLSCFAMSTDLSPTIHQKLWRMQEIKSGEQKQITRRNHFMLANDLGHYFILLTTWNHFRFNRPQPIKTLSICETRLSQKKMRAFRQCHCWSPAKHGHRFWQWHLFNCASTKRVGPTVPSSIRRRSSRKTIMCQTVAHRQRS